MSSSARRNRAFRSRSRSRIWPWIVTSSAVVGSSAMSSLGWQASAAAISARWRSPPDSWCGYSSTRRCGSGTRTASSSSMARARAARPASQAVDLERLGDLAADRVDGIERRHRLLQDQADLAAADRAHRPLVERQEVAPVEPHRAADDPSRRVDQTQDRQRRQRLAAARLADQGQRLAGVEREADARHGGHHAALDGEGRGEAVDVEEGHRGVAGRGCRVRVRLSVVESPGSSRQPARLREAFPRPPDGPRKRP